MDRSKIGIDSDISSAVFVNRIDSRQAGYSGSLNERLSL
jgi:hypothetical protein